MNEQTKDKIEIVLYMIISTVFIMAVIKLIA